MTATEAPSALWPPELLLRAADAMLGASHVGPALHLLAGSGWLVALLAVSACWRGAALRRRVALATAETAHELRGALCAARLALASASRAADRCFGAAGARGGRAIDVAGDLDAVDGELRRAAAIVDDLQAAATARARTGSAELLDLHAVLQHAAPALERAARAHGARLTITCTARRAMVRADRLRLEHAVRNLIINAAEHGGPGIEIAIRADDRRVRLEVHDDGPGLPTPVARTLGQRWPWHGRRSAASRRGHGLAIVRRAAREAGGGLRLLPAERGTRLALELPAADRGAPAAAPRMAAPSRASVFSSR